jgi:predicted SAM-dependent methyltransferase
MTRTEKILAVCDLNGLGLEIGPCYAPILPKANGYGKIEILDHLDKQGLIDKYKDSGVDISTIEEVDYIWEGGSYVDTVKETERFDFIIASNVIEHSVCIIRFIQDCMALLKPGGVLSLVIPDKRYTFDYFRPYTTISEAINCFVNNYPRHNLGSVCEHFLYQATNQGNSTWMRDTVRDMELGHNSDYVKEIINLHNRDSSLYIDTHHWIFTKSSFELLIHDLLDLGFLKDLHVSILYEDKSHEFFASIKKEPGAEQIKTKEKRLRLLRRIEMEFFV